MQPENLSKMQMSELNPIGMDVVIVSANHPELENHWQEILEKGRGTITKKNSCVLAVYEDWPGGAGNGLGSLYSFQKAREKALQLYQIDLYQLLKDGASIALYHTAGKGTRISPLTGSEHNDKSAIKLPGCTQDKQLITLLEAVIKQTAIYAPSRQGRLSVFWGDQVFIPSKSSDYTPTHHIDILAQLFTFPSEEEWNRRELSKYGLIAVHDHQAQNVEKGDYRTICQLIEQKKILADEVGLSLGSFSLSQEMTFALLKEFESELREKKVKLDSDPHFWMAMTLDQQTYLDVMTKKNTPEKEALAHHQRMQLFKNQILSNVKNQQLFGVVDIGENSYWWDYGSTQSYLENNLKLTMAGKEADIMRAFFQVPLFENVKHNPNFEVDPHSILINCRIQSGSIKNSVLANVEANHVEMDQCVAINVVAEKIIAKHALPYNVVETHTLNLPTHTVRADFYSPTSRRMVAMQTTLLRDGQIDWKTVIPPNSYSYEQVNQKNQAISLQTTLQAAAEARQALSHAIQRLPI